METAYKGRKKPGGKKYYGKGTFRPVARTR